MANLPKISAIIVALDEEILIHQIISELKKQSYNGETELILADGGSQDDTVKLAQAQTLKVVIASKKGKACQMNEAAKKATGDILFFVHADMQFSNAVFLLLVKPFKRVTVLVALPMNLILIMTR